MKLNEGALFDILVHVEENVPFTGQFVTVDLASIGSDCDAEELDYAFHLLKDARLINASTCSPATLSTSDGGRKPLYHVQSLTLAGHRELNSLRNAQRAFWRQTSDCQGADR